MSKIPKLRDIAGTSSIFDRIKRPVRVSARITEEAGAILDALASLDPPVKTSDAIEAGIRLVAKHFNISANS